MNNKCGECTRRDCRRCAKTQSGAAWDITRHYVWAQPPVCDRADAQAETYGIALDIGTTTLAFELFDLAAREKTPRPTAAHSRVNSQRAWGPDVITRIARAREGAAADLHAAVMGDIRAGVAHILEEAGVAAEAVRRMAVAGNTTMLHILHGVPCDSLGVVPFAPVFIGARGLRFDFLPRCEAVSLPGVSAFVGADIVAGLGCLGAGGAFLLVDLGTNGEMALVHKGEIFVASTAAGPAFEAANISCGVGSVAGAVSSVKYDENTGYFICETINNAPPIGICGTGVVELTAALVRHGLTNFAGRLQPPYTHGVEIAPNITFTQHDLREVQLAKAAVRAGIELLLDSAECTPDDVSHVYIAGGFGHRLCTAAAAAIGLFPAALARKARPAGNTALGGAAKYLLSRTAQTEAEATSTRAREVNLAAHPRFNALFMEHITFPFSEV